MHKHTYIRETKAAAAKKQTKKPRNQTYKHGCASLLTPALRSQW